MKALLVACCCVVLLGCGADPATDQAVEGTVSATAAAHVGDAPEATPITAEPPARPVLEQSLAYGEAEHNNLVGYLAMPGDAAEPLPGLIVVHEWWGLNENIKAMARRLAGEGYVVLAVDLYDGEVAEAPAAAQALMTRTLSEPEAALDNIRQAHEYLDRYAFAPTVGVIGWCLGGGLALQSALNLPEQIDATVMYYGTVVTDESLLEPLEAPLLGLFGANDSSIPVRDVQRFRSTLRDLGKDAEVLIYSDVGHAFANPSGGTYDAGTAREAWDKTLEFLDAHL